MRRRPGNSIVEVLLAIGIASIVIASVGSLIVSVNRVERASAHRDQAVALAREALEISASIAPEAFACVPAATACPCTPQPGYTSCWSPCPVTVPGCTAASVFHPVTSGGTWQFAAGAESLGSTPAFTRQVAFEPIDADQGLKRVTATVAWEEHGRSSQVVQQTILSGWKNITP